LTAKNAKKKPQSSVVVQFAKNDSYQGMPLGVPRPVETRPRFSDWADSSG
jgi:hypothetical protein